MSVRLIGSLIGLLGLALFASSAKAEDGYDLWLRYRPVEQPARSRYTPLAKRIVADCSTPTLGVACKEAQRGLTGLLARPLSITPLESARDGDLRIVTYKAMPLPGLGKDGFLIRSEHLHGRRLTLIAANNDLGALYGVFTFLRLIQTGRDISHLRISDAPKLPLRMLDHWDNLDETVERGYAGHSLWAWTQLPQLSERMRDYARADASVGINAVVLNNVNADARILSRAYLKRVATLAIAFRPYGIRLFLSARFSAPVELGGLPSADPLDPRVRAWWRSKVDEIYHLIPDFGGLLIKANSEGEPGPQTYGRSHAEGANMIAEALAPHGGTVIWRAFVYSGANHEDRAKQAFDEFRPLDGKFASNVIIQVKNGPIDFQPREPFHPLFGQMPRTRLAMEVQLTKEYLGENIHLAYLGTMWSEVLRSRTYRPTAATEVHHTITALAGVANSGDDRDWTGSEFDQANWFAFGRLAWNPKLSPRTIAEQWTRMTWTNDPRAVEPIVRMMMTSREAVVDYMTPLGLAHQMASGHHYGPGPWISDQPAPLWNPTYYNRADARGIGLDRTASGTNAVSQYAPELANCFAQLRCISDKYLLWFHHLPWTYRMRSGNSLFEELVDHYDEGVSAVEAMVRTWATLKPFIDPSRHAAVAANLKQQLAEAHWWRDASVAYWQSVSKLPLPSGHQPPSHPLSWYEAVHFDTIPGFLAPGLKACLPKGEAPCVH